MSTCGVSRTESQCPSPARWVVRTREASSRSLSAALTARCCAGSSRNQNRKTTHQTTPAVAKCTNAHRHPKSRMASSASGGVMAPPQRAKAHIMACAVTRSRAGIQALSMRVRLGKHPASPAPNRKRITTMEVTFHAAPVSAVHTDHAKTICASTRRTPSRSPSRPMGISKRA